MVQHPVVQELVSGKHYVLLVFCGLQVYMWIIYPSTVMNYKERILLSGGYIAYSLY